MADTDVRSLKRSVTWSAADRSVAALLDQARIEGAVGRDPEVRVVFFSTPGIDATRKGGTLADVDGELLAAA